MPLQESDIMPITDYTPKQKVPLPATAPATSQERAIYYNDPHVVATAHRNGETVQFKPLLGGEWKDYDPGKIHPGLEHVRLLDPRVAWRTKPEFVVENDMPIITDNDPDAQDQLKKELTGETEVEKLQAKCIDLWRKEQTQEVMMAAGEFVSPTGYRGWTVNVAGKPPGRVVHHDLEIAVSEARRLCEKEKRNVVIKTVTGQDPNAEPASKPKTSLDVFLEKFGETKKVESVQIGGSHYKSLAIQPAEFIHRNNISFLEGCVIKRMCRHKYKAKVEDLRKAMHEIQLIAKYEYGIDNLTPQ